MRMDTRSRKQNDDSSSTAPNMIPQTLDGTTYTLYPPASKKPWLSTVFQWIVLPVSIPFLCLHAIGMTIPWIRQAILARMIPYIMNKMSKKFAAERRELLRNVSGCVLDVGSGGGAYLEHLVACRREQSS